uniref:SWIM-type domain-containing protein n=1 Tax=Arundo donax TaxID=35708 RepID=A0A0A9AVD5_ARUDO
MCTRHIYANRRKKYRDQKFQGPFWKCAKASNREMFNYCKALLAQLTPAGAKDMMSTDPIHWSRAWFRIGSNCDSVDNNMCESFNNWIVAVRAHPIISMLEGIRSKTYVRIQQNKFKSEKWPGRICPNIPKKFHKYIEESGKCMTIWNGKDGFEVKHEGKRYKVDIEKRTCSCRYWELSGIPCCHAISAIYIMSGNPEDYIADCYTIEYYNKTYEHCMLPMEGMSSWPISDHPRPSPPGYVKMPGRPRKERRRDPSEPKKATKLSRIGTKMTCRLCKSITHNARKCPQNPEKGKKNIMRKRKQPEAPSVAAESSKQRVPGTKKKASTKWTPASEDHLRASNIFQTRTSEGNN